MDRQRIVRTMFRPNSPMLESAQLEHQEDGTRNAHGVFLPAAPETRQSTQPFTDAIVSAIAAQAGGTAVGSSDSVGALEMAAGAYSRAFAGATVQASDTVKKALSPAILGSIARSLIRRGESVYMINVRQGALHLQPVGSWDVRGGWEPESYVYRLDAFGPSGNRTFLLPAASVIHCKYAYDPARPWFGLSPLAYASLTGSLGAAIQTRLSMEASGPSGYVVPMPAAPQADDTEDDETTEGALTAIKRDLANSKGRTSFVETTNSGNGDRDARPAKDWVSERYGFNAPDIMAVLNSSVGQDILGVCGVPVSLFTDADGTSQRESWRRFVMGSVEPLAVLVAAELSAKLETPVTLDFQNLWAHDLAGRAAAFKALLAGGGGMSIERAVAISGLASMEE